MQKATIASEHTAQRISKTITFYKNESKAASMLQQNGPKPLLLLLPWLGSQPHAVDKYREIYFRQGFDVLTVESKTCHFLWPRWGLDYGAQVLELLQSDSFVSRPLLLHAFSIGGYTFAQMMVHISMNAQQYKSVTDRIKGQVYDSLVIGSVEKMAEEPYSSKIMQKATIASEHTAQRISKTITFFKNESKAASMLQQNGPKPLLLLLPWLGSQPHAVDKYREIYFRQGFDVLTVESKTCHFLWPRWGLDYGAQVLELLQSDSFVSCPLLLHAFSIGGYTFAQMMVHISRNAQQYKSVTDRIKGQIYDSLVIGSVERMAEGVSKMFFPSLQGLVQWSTLLYFRVLEGYTVDYYNAAIEVFWNNPLQTPGLFFHSENDPLSDHKELERLQKKWQQQGITVVYKAWKDSLHAGHLRQHPQEYLATLHQFLQSLNMSPKGKASISLQDPTPEADNLEAIPFQRE
ncbi:UNVERIFIED_CONTAM: hypothetical protein FKN15_048138 [Acipenser sinensis]